MELITRKSECKRTQTNDLLIKSPKEINKMSRRETTPRYCIIVKPFHESFLPYKQIIFRGVTFSDDFSIELIRNNEPVIIKNDRQDILSGIFHSDDNTTFRIMS